MCEEAALLGKSQGIPCVESTSGWLRFWDGASEASKAKSADILPGEEAGSQAEPTHLHSNRRVSTGEAVICACAYTFNLHRVPHS